MKCAEIKESLPAFDREQQPGLAVRRHLAACSDCRAELARYKELAGGLHEMAASVVEVPPALTESLMAIPSERTVLSNVRERASTARTHVTRNRAAYLGGAVALAGAVGATLWRVRTRRPATA